MPMCKRHACLVECSPGDKSHCPTPRTILKKNFPVSTSEMIEMISDISNLSSSAGMLLYPHYIARCSHAWQGENANAERIMMEQIPSMRDRLLNSLISRDGRRHVSEMEKWSSVR
jgi:hypothetical protein